MGSDKKQIKVCHFTSVHKYTDVRIFHKQCVSLVENNYHVFLVAPGDDSFVQNGVEVSLLPPEKQSRKYRSFKFARLIVRKALSLDADIYHFHDPELLRFALKIKRKGKKVIYDVHEDLPRQIGGKHWIRKPLRKLAAFLAEKYEGFYAKRIDLVVTATPGIRERFKQYNKNTIDINNYPIVDEFSNISFNLEANNVCYVGGIMHSRGNSHLQKAISQMECVGLNLAGVFIPDSYQDEQKNKPGWDKTNFIGFVGRQEIGKVLGNSFAGMVTLMPMSNYIESLPVKMFEYMAAGLPVVASDFPLWRAIIEEADAGFLVNPEDIEAIKASIQYLFENKQVAKEMGERGRELVINKYNWKNEKDKLVKAYKQLFK